MRILTKNILSVIALAVSGTALHATPFTLFEYSSASPTGLRARDVTQNNIDYTGDGNATDGYSRFSFADLGSNGWSVEDSEPRLFGGVAAVRVNKSAGFDTYGYGGSLDLRAQSNSPVGHNDPDPIPITGEMNPFRLAAFWETSPTGAADLYELTTGIGRSDLVTGRFMLRNTDGNFYVSETSFGGGTTSLDQATLQGTLWSVVDVESWLNDATFDEITLNFTNLTPTIGMVNAAGLFVERNDATGNRVWSTINSYQVTAIPEPSTILVSLLGGLLLIKLARRRNR